MPPLRNGRSRDVYITSRDYLTPWFLTPWFLTPWFLSLHSRQFFNDSGILNRRLTKKNYWKKNVALPKIPKQSCSARALYYGYHTHTVWYDKAGLKKVQARWKAARRKCKIIDVSKYTYWCKHNFAFKNKIYSLNFFCKIKTKLG